MKLILLLHLGLLPCVYGNNLKQKSAQHRRAQLFTLAPISIGIDKVSSPTFSPQTKQPSRRPTNEPSQSPTNPPTSFTPTDSPTSTPTDPPTPSPIDSVTSLPTLFPTFEPTKDEVKVPPTAGAPPVATRRPIESPTQLPSVATAEQLDDLATIEPTSIAPSISPSKKPAFQAITPTSNLQQNDYEDSIVALVQSMANTIKFNIQLSIWSSDGIPKAGEEFEPISEAVLTSIRMLYCEDVQAAVCVVRNDLLLTSEATSASEKQEENNKVKGVVEAKEEAAKRKTLAVPSIGKVIAVEEEYFTYTSWEVNIEILQLGRQYVQQIISHLKASEDTSIEELRALIPRMIQDKVTLDVEKSIREGTFDGLMHGALGDDDIVSAVAGEEHGTFSFFIANNSPTKDMPGARQNDGPDLTLIAIYVAIAVVLILFTACMLVFYYYNKIQSQSNPPTENKQKDTSKTAEDESTSGADNDSMQNSPQKKDGRAMISPSIASDSDVDDLSTALASWQRKPARFVLQIESQCQSESDQPDDATDFPTAGSLVAGSVMVGSMMAESVESSLDGWSVHAADINWS